MQVYHSTSKQSLPASSTYGNPRYLTIFILIRRRRGLLGKMAFAAVDQTIAKVSQALAQKPGAG